MRSIFKEIIYFFIRITGLPFFFREVLRNNKVSILTFHNMSVNTAVILANVIKKKYQTISLEQYKEAIISKDKTKLPNKSIIVTLDDGYIENIRIKEIMQKNGIIPTIFICADVVNTNKRLWFQYSLSKDEIKELKKIKEEEKLEYLKMKYGEHSDNNTRTSMNLEEINSLKGIFDFQYHTATHPILSNCNDTMLEYELNESKEKLEKLLGLKFYAIAYPNGTFNDNVIEKVKKYDFIMGLTMDYGNNGIENPYLISRIPVDDDAGINEIIVKSSGFYDFIIKKILKLRNYNN